MARPLPFSIFVCFLFATGISNFGEAMAGPFQQTAPNGAAGAAGDPGTDGGHGTHGADVDSDTISFRQVASYAQNGGLGGRGGEGIDGDDENDWAAGGNGGHGGNGGNALAVVEGEDAVQIFARGGWGGNGGRFGWGTHASLDGVSGNGGHGGNAQIQYAPLSNSTFVTQKIVASGGAGGHAYGLGASAGNGGRARVNVNLTQPFFRSTIRLYGGFGGNGNNGADGGDGASSNFGYQTDSLQWDEVTGFRSRMDVTVWGGGGGSSVNGVAGSAGSGRLSLSAWAGEHGGSNRDSGSLTIRGGAGGKGTATGSQVVSGMRGAIGLLDAASDTIYRQGFLTANIRGGNGGSALGRFNSGDGGHGAAAVVRGTTQVDNRFDLAGEHDQRYTNYTLNLRSGDGGHAQGTGRSGNGASVNVNQPFSIKTNSTGLINVVSTAGSGGWGRLNGNGGDSNVTINNAIAGFDPESPSLTTPYNEAALRVTSFGGSAGGGLNSTNAANGGDATITLMQSGNRTTTMTGRAVAGAGNYGRSGDARVVAHGHAGIPDGIETARLANVTARAEGAKFNSGGFQASAGSNAYAEAVATSESSEGISTNRTLARAVAHGGWGFQRSGSADAIARASSQYSNARASSGALVMGDNDALSDNYARANSEAISLVEAFAESQALGTGRTEYLSAQSVATAPKAEVQSTVNSAMLNWQHDARVSGGAVYQSESNSSATVTSGSGFSFRGNQFRATEQDVSSDLVLMPNAGWADDFISENSMLGDIFVASNSADVLGAGRFGFQFSDPDADGSLTAWSTMDFSYQVRDFQNDENLILGLFELGASGDAFEQMDLSISLDGRAVVNETFQTFEEASTFFDGQFLDFGAMPGDREMLDFKFDVGIDLNSPGSGFDFGFVFGNATAPSSAPQFSSFSAVPEPSAFTLLGLITLGCTLRRRRD